MNIFEFLGLPANHREKNKVTQLVKHWCEVPDSEKKKQQYLAEIKKDGIFCHVLSVDGCVEFFSRTGMLLQNTFTLSQKHSGLPEGAYMAELCCLDKSCSLEELSGIFNPNRVNELSEKQLTTLLNCDLFFHDLVSIQDFIDGQSATPAFSRHTKLAVTLPYNSHIISRIVVNATEVESFAEQVIASGEEGAVFKLLWGEWEAGHKGYKSMKIVRGISYDLLCIGVEEGKGKYSGKVANLLFRWKDGKTIKAMLGKGYTHKDAKGMLDNSPIGYIFTVTALQESSKGVLRLPKVGPIRFDKSEPDF